MADEPIDSFTGLTRKAAREELEKARAVIVGAARGDEARQVAIAYAKLLRPGCEGDIIDTLAEVRAALAMGMAQYSAWAEDNGGRDLMCEALQESLDMNSYLAKLVRDLRAKVRDLETTVRLLEGVAARARLETLADEGAAGGSNA